MAKKKVSKRLDLTEFVEIKDYEGYFVNKKGEVYSTRGIRSVDNPLKLKSRLQNGYPSVSIYSKDDTKNPNTLYIHRAVAISFIPNSDKEKDCVNHIDGNKENNSISNLEWVTKAENNLHAFQSGLMTNTKYSREQCLEVVDRYHNKGESVMAISKDMGVNYHFVNDLIKKGSSIKSKEGLGDEIEAILNSKLVKPLTDALKKIIWKDDADCGCDERKEKLNKMFPYSKKPECLKQKEFKFLDRIYKANARAISREDNRELYTIYNRVFNAKKVSTTCGSCVKSVMNELKRIYNEYVE